MGCFFLALSSCTLSRTCGFCQPSFLESRKVKVKVACFSISASVAFLWLLLYDSTNNMMGFASKLVTFVPLQKHLSFKNSVWNHWRKGSAFALIKCKDFNADVFSTTQQNLSSGSTRLWSIVDPLTSSTTVVLCLFNIHCYNLAQILLTHLAVSWLGVFCWTLIYRMHCVFLTIVSITVKMTYVRRLGVYANRFCLSDVLFAC